MLKSKNTPTLTGAAAAALTSLAMTQAALAAGPVSVATPEPLAIGSTGQWYAGVEFGTASGVEYTTTRTLPNDDNCYTNGYDYSDNFSGSYCGTAGAASADPDGTARGIFVGYNTTRGEMLIGGELRAMSFSDPSAVDLLPIIPGIFTVKAGFGDLYELRARVGQRMSDKAMVYGALGFSQASFDVEVCALGICSTVSTDDTAPTAGVGLEYDLTETTFIGADYSMRQFEFGSEEMDLNTLTLRLGYRF